MFALQLALIAVTTVVGIYLTQVLVEDLLTRQALESEAEHYWGLWQEDATVSLPNTANMRGYVRRPGTTFQGPEALAQLPVGYHDVTLPDGKVLVHVSERADTDLLLAFEGEQVSDLAFYFGILPLSIVLLAMYGVAFLAYRSSQRAMSPIITLAERLEQLDFDGVGALQLDPSDFRAGDSEVGAMVTALEHFTNRLNRALERERHFTSDASHELRTPVAVMKNTLDLMERQANGEAAHSKPLRRLRRATEDIEALLQSLLLLAREETASLPSERCDVNRMLSGQLSGLHELAEQNRNRLRLLDEAHLVVQAPGQLLDIVTSNLIRNALLYTEDGTVEVCVKANSIEVRDSGVGMSQEQLEQAFEPFYRADESRGKSPGHGLGLSIVRRVVDVLGWQLSLASERGAGTVATLSFEPRS